MQKILNFLLTSIHLFAALSLIAMSLIIMGWSILEVIYNVKTKGDFIPLMIQSIGAIIIAAAVIDVARYIIDEEVFMTKELREPEEARKTITKILVIITIGKENRKEVLKNCSLVATSYNIGGATGTLGIIGPTRMDYPKVISLVDYIAEEIGNLFNKH